MRLPDWEDRLHAYLDSVAGAPFAYGRHDCALHGANAVEAMTGADFGTAFRGKYRSAAGATRALKLYGAGDLVATFTAALGAPINPAFAGRGDLVLHADPSSGGSIGVGMAGFAWFAGEEDGLPGLVAVTRPAGGWSLAWKV
jgi:hypothetical protein